MPNLESVALLLHLPPLLPLTCPLLHATAALLFLLHPPLSQLLSTLHLKRCSAPLPRLHVPAQRAQLLHLRRQLSHLQLQRLCALLRLRTASLPPHRQRLSCVQLLLEAVDALVQVDHLLVERRGNSGRRWGRRRGSRCQMGGQERRGEKRRRDGGRLPRCCSWAERGVEEVVLACFDSGRLCAAAVCGGEEQQLLHVFHLLGQSEVEGQSEGEERSELRDSSVIASSCCGDRLGLTV